MTHPVESESREFDEQVKEGVRPTLKDGYPQCWYPVSLAEGLRPGEILGKDLCDGGIIVYRDSSNEVHVLSRFCKHVGADLSLGDIVGDDVRCPFHHWQYGPDGVCTKIATGDPIPRRARLFSFPVQEKWGLIWVFWGPEPLYEVPGFSEAVDLSSMIWKAYEFPLPQPLRTESYIFCGNGIDFQHLQSVHGLPVFDPGMVSFDEYSFTYANAMVFRGGNCSSAHGEGRYLGLGWDTAYMAASAPMGREGQKLFFVEAVSVGDGSAEERAEAERRLEYMHNHHTRVFSEDVPILNSLDLSELLLVGADRALAKYFRWARDYPRMTMAELRRVAEHAR